MELQPDYWAVLRMATSKPPNAAGEEPTSEPANNHGAGLAFNVGGRVDMLTAAQG
jgi:hypothetical protein